MSDPGVTRVLVLRHASAITRPAWDAHRRLILCGDRVVKRFRGPAKNQTLILDAFQEEGWPGRIDDPLAPGPDDDPSARLRDAVRRLNRRQCYPVLRFCADGTGQGVCWSWEQFAARPV